jgi:hypothetical protein
VDPPASAHTGARTNRAPSTSTSAGAAAPGLSLGASPATVSHALTAIVVMALLAALATAAALFARSRRALGSGG